MASTSSHMVCWIALIFLVMLAHVHGERFIARTLPTSVSSRSTHFDGLLECPSDCTKNDQIQLLFLSTSPQLFTHITPTKFRLTFFLDSTDEIVGTAKGSFKNMASEAVKIDFSKTIPKTTLLRFGGTVEYDFINKDAYNRVSNVSITFELLQGAINAISAAATTSDTAPALHQQEKYTAKATLFYTKVLNEATTSSMNLIHDDGKTNTYHVYANIHHLPFETNHFIIRTFGSLRSTPQFDPALVECTINSLKFNVAIAQDALGDDYFELTLDKTPYLASYHFPSRIDLALQCMFGQKLPNKSAPFGMSIQFVPKSDESLPSNDHSPAAVIVGDAISVVTWGADFLKSYKFLYNHDSYQFAYLPYDLKEDEKKKVQQQQLTVQQQEEAQLQSVLAQLNKQPLHRITTGPTQSSLITTTAAEDANKVYRSHYSYLFRINGANLEWDSSDLWFDTKLQNTHRGKHISTNWSHFVTKTLSTDKTINDVTMFATGTLEPIDSTSEDKADDNVNNQFIFPKFSFDVSKAQSDKNKSPVSFLSMQIVIEHDKLPQVAELHPASIALTLNHKVKREQDQPLSLFKHLAAVSYPYSKPFVTRANDLVVKPTELEYGKGEQNLRKYKLDITLTNPTENSDLIHFYLGSHEYFFKGDFTTCKFNDKTVPGVTTYKEPFKGDLNGYIVSFSLPDQSDIVVKGQTLTVACPDGALVSSNDPDKEPDFYHESIYFAFIGYDVHGEVTSLGAHYASARIGFTDHLSAPEKKGMGIAGFLMAACIILTLGSLAYVAWIYREKFPCLKRFHRSHNYDSQPTRSTSVNGGGDYLDDLGSKDNYEPPVF